MCKPYGANMDGRHPVKLKGQIMRIDRLEEDSYELIALKTVLKSWGYSTEPHFLNDELHDLSNLLATYRDESKELDSLRERYYEEL